MGPAKWELCKGERGIPNPLLVDCLHPWLFDYCVSQRAKQWRMVFAQLDQKPDDDCWFNEVDEVDDHFLCKDAVWRQMLFQQPPQLLFGIFHADSLHLDDELAYTDFKWPDLLRLGVIFDKILSESIVLTSDSLTLSEILSSFVWDMPAKRLS